MLRPLIFCTLIFAAAPFTVAAQSPRPNIIYIMADDMGYADLSCYGHKDYQTRHLDKLASQGVKFMNAYAAAPICTPTRTAFMTGRYPSRTPVGLMEPLRGARKDSLVGLTANYTSVATLLKKNGYETYLVGKWHLGFDSLHSPMRNGFDYFFGFNSGGIDYISHTNRNGRGDLYEIKMLIKKEGYTTDLWRDKSVEIISAEHKKPFFLSIMFNAPHWPWQAPGDKPYPDTLSWLAGGSKEKYVAMIKSLDDAVGKIIKAIDDKNIANNTLVIFTSDNGGEQFSDMGIYAGKKGQLYEGGIREPAFIRWPGIIAPNTITEQVAITMDWTATILAAAKVKPDPAFALDGIDLMPVCTGQKKIIERTFYWRLFQDGEQKAMRQANWKYLQYEKSEFLFNITDDPSEKTDIKAKHPDVFSQLKKKYSEWESGVLTPVPL
ncbi:MAG: sulfatase-like hydrolase/transferase [Ferruginibacter sp.]